MKSSNFIFEEETEWEELSEGVRRQIMGYDDEIMLVKVDFKAGAEGALHTHPHRQCTYVVSGVFEFAIGEQTKTVRMGDALYLKPDVEHGVKCIEAGILVDVFHPVRKDFLN
jgi:quercetin dioxygenase-like cupin family protein